MNFISLPVVFYPVRGVVTACEGDTLTLTCVTDTGILYYRLVFIGSKFFKFYSSAIAVKLMSVSTSGVFTTVATVIEASPTLNGTVITCKDQSVNGSQSTASIRY